ncbi:MAG: hypothetical protein WC375_10260 [Methanomassiliicoccales archaeon]
MEKSKVIYCADCEMWFDTKNGWKALKAEGIGIPVCPACGSVLMEADAEGFYESNRLAGRLEEVKTWEWPNGSIWKIETGDLVLNKAIEEKIFVIGIKRENDVICSARTMGHLSDCELIHKGSGINQTMIRIRDMTFGDGWDEPKMMKGE